MFTRLKVCLCLAALAGAVALPAADRTAIPGTLNYLEGQVSIDGRQVSAKSNSSEVAEQNQVVETSQGKAEMLLTPGVFLRMGDNSAVRMVSPSLSNTRVELVRGEAIMEVAELFNDNDLRVGMDGATTMLAKRGLYNFDANRGMVRVYDGEAFVQQNDQQVKLKKGREVSLEGPLLVQKFDRDAAHDALYAWSNLRSEYEAEASMQSARTVVVGGPGWYGPGWYWNPGWGMYGFVPAGGIIYSPFGWPFYSPVVIYRAPIYRPGFGRVVVPSRPGPATAVRPGMSVGRMPMGMGRMAAPMGRGVRR